MSRPRKVAYSFEDAAPIYETIRRAIEDAGFALRRRTVWFGFLSEHVAVKRAAPGAWCATARSMALPPQVD